MLNVLLLVVVCVGIMALPKEECCALCGESINSCDCFDLEHEVSIYGLGDSRLSEVPKNRLDIVGLNLDAGFVVYCDDGLDVILFFDELLEGDRYYYFESRGNRFALLKEPILGKRSLYMLNG